MTKYDDHMPERVVEIFSDALLQGPCIAQVAVKLGISRTCYYEWKEAHPEFRMAAEMGETIAEAYWSMVNAQLATGKIENANVTALIFLLKNRFRASYGEQQQKSVSQSVVESVLGLLNGAE